MLQFIDCVHVNHQKKKKKKRLAGIIFRGFFSISRMPRIYQEPCVVDLCTVIDKIWNNWYIRTEKAYIWLTLMFNSNIRPNSVLLRSIRLRNFSDPELDFSRLLKVKCHSITGLPIIIYFLININSNIWPNSAPFQDIRLWNVSDLDFHLLRLVKVKWCR